MGNVEEVWGEWKGRIIKALEKVEGEERGRSRG